MTAPHPKLSLLLPSLAAGGVGRSMLHLAGAFHAAGHPVDLVLCRAEGPYMSEVPPGVRIVELRRQSGLSARLQIARLDPDGIAALARPVLLPWSSAPVQPYVSALARYLSTEQPAALLAAKTPTNLLALWASRLSGADTRIVISEHTQLSQSITLSRKWRWRHIAPVVARTYPGAAAIVSVSNGVADDLAATAQLPRDSIDTIYNPVVTPSLAAQASEPAPHPWLEDGGAPVIVAAGRLTPQKNFPMLMRAFARLRERHPARLLLLGEGPERNKLESLASTLGIHNDVALPGFISNPYAAFSRAALFVISSDYEGLGNVLIEALACGCPVVSTDCPSGPSEILENGRYGELIPVNDSEALSAAMLRTLKAQRPKDELRRRGAEFSLERSARQYLDLLMPPFASSLESERQQNAAPTLPRGHESST